MKTATQKLFVLMIALFAFLHTNVYATKWIVNVQNFSFSPASLPSVIVGDTVHWVWISGSHTTTSTTIPPSTPTWDQPLNVSNQFFEYVPTIVGTYNYKCTPHEGSGMIGSFIVSPLPIISLNLKVFLEGPFIGSGMNTELNISGLIPLNQPYNISPWNYEGTENVASIPNADIVDWVLLELRETSGDASTATANKQIHRQAAFLLSDGNIVSLDGSSLVIYNGTITNNLYVVIWHRNHLAVMSSGALTEVSGDYTWDFSGELSKAYLNGQKQLMTGIYGMIGGDSDASGIVLGLDLNPGWTAIAGEIGYISGDLNLDGQASNPDKNDIWDINNGLAAKLPWYCSEQLIDLRDFQSYNTVQIGTQCWMAENLNIGAMIPGTTEMANNSIIEKYCYENNTANCDTYGGLYQWNEMMEYSNTPEAQGICPANWHVPADAEWTALTDFLGGETVAGGKMKTTGTIESGTGLWHAPNTGTTNESGFSALPGALRLLDGGFNSLGYSAYFWSATNQGTDNAWDRYMNYSSINVSTYGDGKFFGFSVRCVQNNINQPPSAPSTPQPSEGAIDEPTSTIISWSCTDPENDPLTFDVYFGTSNTPPLVSPGQTAFSYDPGILENNTTYYWKIVAHDDHSNSTESQEWNFMTIGMSFAIGQNYGGGIIFYIDGTGQHGLIAAPENITTDLIPWSNGTFIETGATGLEIGSGNANTISIVNAQGDGNYAAKLCYDLDLNGFSDWYLPSSFELLELIIHQNEIGGFTFGWYWSSSESSVQFAILLILSGSGQANFKNLSGNIRAVRSF